MASKDLFQKNDESLAFQISSSIEYLEERESVNLNRLFEDLFVTFIKEIHTKETSEIQIEADYHGVKLGETFEENDFKEMVNDFRSNRTLHAKYALKIIDETIELLNQKPNIPQLNMNPNEKEECIIVGDLHGHFDDLMTILNNFNIPGKECYFVFNGDWVNVKSRE
jgi:hypothetical protein